MSEAKLNQLLENKNMKKIQIFLYNNKICSLLRLFIKSLFKMRVERFLRKNYREKLFFIFISISNR